MFTFLGGTPHGDITISSDGLTVSVPSSSCHGGYPVRGSVTWLPVGGRLMQWKIAVLQGTARVGVRPAEGTTDPDDSGSRTVRVTISTGPESSAYHDAPAVIHLTLRFIDGTSAVREHSVLVWRIEGGPNHEANGCETLPSDVDAWEPVVVSCC